MEVTSDEESFDKFKSILKKLNKYGVKKEIDRYWTRVEKIEERLRKIICRLGKIEKRIKLLELVEDSNDE